MASRQSNSGWIEVPAFVQITLGNGTQIKGRFASYTDPSESSGYGAFQAVDREGVQTYVLWAAIAHLTVFPLGTEPPDEA
jgi:hypothetical protein